MSDDLMEKRRLFKWVIAVRRVDGKVPRGFLRLRPLGEMLPPSGGRLYINY